MSNILVTGGAGFIGANFIYYLLDKYPNDRIICLDKLTYAGNLNTLQQARRSERFLFIREDICHQEAVFSVFENECPDMVVNFAAESHVDRSIDNASIFLETNILGTRVLLDACRKYKVQRFHQVSTDEVYGDLPLNRPDLFFTEDSHLKPSNPYSASKASADLLALSYHHTFGLPVTITRCSNNYGPYQFPEKLIPLMITKAMKNEHLPVYGKGMNVRDWLHVVDHCSAVDLVMRRGDVGAIYNVGGNTERNNLQVVQMILQALGKPKSLIRFVQDRPGHDLRYAIDSSKLMTELGWQPKVTFHDGMKETISWYQNNDTWWQRIFSGEYLKDNAKLD